MIALARASTARHALALRQLGLEQRLSAEIALDVSLEALLDPLAVRSRIASAGRDPAGAIVLGCAGMAHHMAAVEDAAGIPVVEPAQAAAAAALARVLPARMATIEHAAD